MLKSTRPSNSGYDKKFEDVNVCPICKHSISPIYLSSRTHHNATKLSVYCECTSCGNPFIALFSKSTNDESYYNSTVFLAPEIPEKICFDKHISEVSQQFVNIFNEAKAAEVYHLNNIAGMGYRKALEFLIKDYCIYKNPDKEAEIKSKLLGQVINDYVDSDKIQTLSKASSWIGNDETHYVRKFEDKDINDLKMFIDATVNFITYELIFDEATSITSSS